MKPARRPQRSALCLAVLATLAMPVMAGSFDWTSGYYSTVPGLPNPLLASDVLTVAPGGTKVLDLNFSSQGTVRQTDDLYLFGYISATSSGLWDLQADVGLANGGYFSGFVNNGVFRKSAGSGSSVISGIAFTNTGTIDVRTGVIDFASGSAAFNAGSQFTGAGRAVVSNSAVFSGAFSAGNLELRAGSFAGAAAELHGSVDWTGGALSGTWTVAAGQTLNVIGGGTKTMSANLVNAGNMRATDTLYLFGYNTLTNTGLYDLQGDVGLANAGYSNVFANSGTFRKSAGSGTSTVGSGTAFTNSGVIDVQVGAIDFAGGDASFLDGTRFAGAGQVVVSSNATFIGSQQTEGNLSLVAGTFGGGNGNADSRARLDGDARWAGGWLQGKWTVAAGRTLDVGAGSAKTMAAALTNEGRIRATDDLLLFGYNTLTNNGSYELKGDVKLLSGGYSNAFVNYGSFVKSAGSGSSVVGGSTGFDNRGVIEAQTGTIEFAGGDAIFRDGTRFAGAGQVVVSNSATFIGSQQTAANLGLTAGSFIGGDGNPDSRAILDGDARWTGGWLQGKWTVAGGRTLDVAAGSAKYMNAALVNEGHIRATDDLYLFGYNTLTNQGTYELKGDVGVWSGGYSNTFVNNGSFTKSAGGGTSVVGGSTGFQNNGVIEAKTGSLEFAGGDVTFNHGTQFKGPGQVVVTNNAQFNGSYTTAGNLTLAGGAYGGTAARVDGDTAWTGGTLQGEWSVAAGRTLHAKSGSAKTIHSDLSNEGTLLLSDNVFLFGYRTLTNTGRVEFANDAGVSNGGYSNAFVNNGLLVKSGGSGSSSVADNAFVNNGTVDVMTGTIVLPSDFTNAGTLMGLGTYALGGTLINAGHVAPGTSPGTLAIAGKFAQTAAGVFDVDVNTLGSTDLLLVSGTAALDGTLALHCWASCSFAVGDEFVILDSAGDLAGSFAGGITKTGFGSGEFETVYDALNDRVLLRVTQAVTAVPEPGSWALMLGGLAALGGLTRRRV